VRRRRAVTYIALGAVSFAPLVARAQPVRTWGGEDDRPPPVSTGTPTVTTATASPAPPPPPAAPPQAPAEAPAEGNAPIVRAPGMIGLRYTLQGIEVTGNTTTLARVILRYVPYRPGDVIDVDDKELELTRFRLLGTGFFRDVELSLRKGSQRGYVVLVVNVEERNTIVIDNVWLGLSADADPNGNARPLTAYGGAAVSETNLAGTGLTLGGAFAVADGQLALRTRFADPQFLRTSWTAEAQLLYNNARDFFGNRDVLVDDPTQPAEDFAVVQYQRFGGSVGAGHDLGISTQLFFDYRLESIDATLPRAASTHRGLDIVPIDFSILGGHSVLSTLRATLSYDTRDEPILPSRGNYVVIDGDASLTPFGSDYPYVKLESSLSHWFPLSWGHILRIDGFAGAVFGTAPMFERFYVGDFSDLLPDRVLGLNFDRRAAPNFLNTDIAEIRYGDYAAKLETEYRIPLYRGHRSIYGVDFFTSAGVYGVANGEDFVDHARGYTGFSTVPVDLTFNLGLRIDTQAGGFLFALSNLIGFFPIHGDQGAGQR
jgi:outer membrane protein insertion porin family